MLAYPVRRRNALVRYGHIASADVGTVTAIRTPSPFLNPIVLYQAIYDNHVQEDVSLACKYMAMESLLSMKCASRRQSTQDDAKRPKTALRIASDVLTFTDVWQTSLEIRNAILSHLQPSHYIVIEELGQLFHNDTIWVQTWKDACRLVDLEVEKYKSMLKLNEMMRRKRFVLEKLRIKNARYYCMVCNVCLSQKCGNGNGDYNCVGCDDCHMNDPYGFACIKCIDMTLEQFKCHNNTNRTFYCDIHRQKHGRWQPWWKTVRRTRTVTSK